MSHVSGNLLVFEVWGEREVQAQTWRCPKALPNKPISSHGYPNPWALTRDVQPIDGAGHARVADMGLARRLEPGAAATLTGETGTYYYMAPEMFRHEVCACVCVCVRSSRRCTHGNEGW